VLLIGFIEPGERLFVLTESCVEVCYLQRHWTLERLAGLFGLVNVC
jgi:hypothetical protein